LVGERSTTINGLIATIIYGGIFTFIQGYEYNVAPFSINDGVFGSLFFLLTGFHGLHVIIGTIFLIICFIRQLDYHFTCKQHVGFESGIWY
jgi:heme/copper-type cytochrome/quinol oxidase subunit 3